MGTPITEERRLLSRAAAYDSWAATPDRAARTANGRTAFLIEKFEKQVDPDGVLAPDERARRAEYARKAYFTRLAVKSAQARRRGKALIEQADAADEALAEDRGAA